MISQFLLRYLMPENNNRSNLSLIFIISSGIISAIIFQGFMAYFAFITFTVTYEYSLIFTILYLAGIFYAQAVILFTIAYFISKKTSKYKSFTDECCYMSKLKNAFTSGFKTKS